jgi:hypothetical protein
MAENPKQRFRRILNDLSNDDRTFLDSGLRRMYSESLSYGLKQKFLTQDEVGHYQRVATNRDTAIRKIPVLDQTGRPMTKETTVPLYRNGQIVQEKRVTPVTPIDLLKKTGGQMDGGPTDGPIFTGFTLDLETPLGQNRKKFQEQVIPAAQQAAQKLEKTQGVSSMSGGKYAAIGAGALAGPVMGASKDAYALSLRAMGVDPNEIAQRIYSQPQAGLDNPFMFGAERSAIAGQTFAQSILPSIAGTGAGILVGGGVGVANPVAGLLAGVGTAMATTAGVQKAQDWLLGAAFGKDLMEARQNQMAQQMSENPFGAYAGELATNLVLAKPNLPDAGDFMVGAKSAVRAGRLAKAARPLVDAGVNVPTPSIPMVSPLQQSISQGRIAQGIGRAGQAVQRSAVGRAANLDVLSAAAKGFASTPEGYRFATDIAERGIEGSVDLAIALNDKKTLDAQGKPSDSYLTILAKTLAGSMFEGEHRLGRATMAPFVRGGEALGNVVNQQFGTSGMFPFGPKSSAITPKVTAQTPQAVGGQTGATTAATATNVGRILPENMVPMGNGRIGIINRDNFSVQQISVNDIPDEFKNLRLAFGDFDAAAGKNLLDGVKTLKPEENGWFRSLFLGPKGMEGAQQEGQMEMLLGATQEGLVVTRDLSPDNTITTSVKSVDMLAPQNKQRADQIFSASGVQPASVTGYAKSGYDFDAVRSLETSGINPKEFNDEFIIGDEVVPGRIVAEVDERHVAMQVPSPNGGFDFIVTPVANLETRNRKVREVFDFTQAIKSDPSQIQVDRKRHNPFFTGSDRISLQGINGAVLLTPEQMAQVQTNEDSIDGIVTESRNANDAVDVTITKERKARENASDALVKNTFVPSDVAFDNGTLIEHKNPDGTTSMAVVVGDTPVGPVVVSADNPTSAYVVQDSAVVRSSSEAVSRAGVVDETVTPEDATAVAEPDAEVVADAEAVVEEPIADTAPSTETVRRRRPRRTREELDAAKAERERKKAEEDAKRAEEEARKAAELEQLRKDAEQERKRLERERRRLEEDARRREEAGAEATPTPEETPTGISDETLQNLESRIADLEAQITAATTRADDVTPADITAVAELTEEEEQAQQQQLMNNLHPMDVAFVDDRSAVAVTGSIEGVGDITEVLRKARSREELADILEDFILRSQQLKTKANARKAAEAVSRFYDEMIHAFVNRDIYHAQLLMQGETEFFRVQRTRTASGYQGYGEVAIPEDASYAQKRVLRQRNKVARLMQKQDMPRFQRIIGMIEQEANKIGVSEYRRDGITFKDLTDRQKRRLVDNVRLDLIRDRYATNTPVFKVLDTANKINEEFEDTFYRTGGYVTAVDRTTNVGQQIIFAFTNTSDISTTVHELSHAILDNMPVNMAAEVALHMGATLREPTVSNPSLIPFEVHERFATMMEQSFISGSPINLNTRNGRVSAGQQRINEIWKDISGFMRAAYATTYGHKRGRTDTDWSQTLLEWSVPYVAKDVQNNEKLSLWKKLPVVLQLNGRMYRATVVDFEGQPIVRTDKLNNRTVTVEFIDPIDADSLEGYEVNGKQVVIAPGDIRAFGGIIKGMNTQLGSMIVKWVSGYTGVRDAGTGVSVPIFGLDNSFARATEQLATRNVPGFLAQLDGKDVDDLTGMFQRLIGYEAQARADNYSATSYANLTAISNGIAAKITRIAKDAYRMSLIGDVDIAGTLQPNNVNNWLAVADVVRQMPEKMKAGQTLYMRQVGPNGKIYNVKPVGWIQRGVAELVKIGKQTQRNHSAMDVLAQAEGQVAARNGGNSGSTVLSQSKRAGIPGIARTENIQRANANRTPEAVGLEDFASQATADGVSRDAVVALVNQRITNDIASSIPTAKNVRAIEINDILVIDGTVDASANTSMTVAKTLDFAMRNGIDNTLMVTKAMPSEPLGYSNKGYSVEPSVTFTSVSLIPDAVYFDLKRITPLIRQSSDGRSVTIHNLEEVGQSYEKSLDTFASTVERVADSLNKRGIPVQAFQNTERVWNFGNSSAKGYAIPYSEARNVLHFLLPEAYQQSLDPKVDNVTQSTIESVLTNIRGGDVRLPTTFDARSLPDNLERRIAMAENYGKLPTNTLAGDYKDADTVKAYASLVKELERQFKYLNLSVAETGSSSSAKVYMALNTEDRTGLWANHPLLKDSPFRTIDGKRMRYADVLNAIHRSIKKGVEITTAGQYKDNLAFATHAALTQDPWATWALWTETVGRQAFADMKGADIRKAGLASLEDVKTGIVGIDKRLEIVRREAEFPSGTANATYRSDAMAPAQFAVGGTTLFQSRPIISQSEPLTIVTRNDDGSLKGKLDPIDSNVAFVESDGQGGYKIVVNPEATAVINGDNVAEPPAVYLNQLRGSDELLLALSNAYRNTSFVDNNPMHEYMQTDKEMTAILNALNDVIQHESLDSLFDEYGNPEVSDEDREQIGQERDAIQLAAGLSPAFAPTDDSLRNANELVENVLDNLRQDGRQMSFKNYMFRGQSNSPSGAIEHEVHRALFPVQITAVDQLQSAAHLGAISDSDSFGNLTHSLQSISQALLEADANLIAFDKDNMPDTEFGKWLAQAYKDNGTQIEQVAHYIKSKVKLALQRAIADAWSDSNANRNASGEYSPLVENKLDAKDYDSLNNESNGEAERIVSNAVQSVIDDPNSYLTPLMSNVYTNKFGDFSTSDVGYVLSIAFDVNPEALKTEARMLVQALEHHVVSYNDAKDGMNYASKLFYKKLQQTNEFKHLKSSTVQQIEEYIKDNFGFEDLNDFQAYVIHALFQHGTVLGDKEALKSALIAFKAGYDIHSHRRPGDNLEYVRDWLKRPTEHIDTSTGNPIIPADRYTPDGKLRVYHGTGFGGIIAQDQLVPSQVVNYITGKENPGGGGTGAVASVTYMPVYAQSVTQIVNNVREVLLNPDKVHDWIPAGARRMKSAILNSRSGKNKYEDLDAFVMSQNFLDRLAKTKNILDDPKNRQNFADIFGDPETIFAWVTGKNLPQFDNDPYYNANSNNVYNDLMTLEAEMQQVADDYEQYGVLPPDLSDFDATAYKKHRETFDVWDMAFPDWDTSSDFYKLGFTRARYWNLLKASGYTQSYEYQNPTSQYFQTLEDFNNYVIGQIKTEFNGVPFIPARSAGIRTLHDITFGDISSGLADGGGWGYPALGATETRQNSALGLPSFLIVSDSLDKWAQMTPESLQRLTPAMIEFELDGNSLTELAFSENELRLYSGRQLSAPTAIYDASGKKIATRENIEKFRQVTDNASAFYYSSTQPELMAVRDADGNEVILESLEDFPSTKSQGVQWSSRRKKGKANPPATPTPTPPPALKKLKPASMSISTPTTYAQQAQARKQPKPKNARLEMVDNLLKPYDFVNTIARNSVGGDWSAPLIQNWALTNPFENPKMFFQQFLIGTKMMKPNLGFQLADGRIINSNGMLGRKEFHDLGNELRASGFYQLGKEAGLITNTSRVDEALAEAQSKDPRKTLMDIDELGHDPDFAIAHSILKRIPLNTGAERTMSMQKDYIKQMKFNAAMRSFIEMGYSPKAKGFLDIAKDFAAVLNVAAGDIKFVADDEKDELIGRMTKRILFAPRWASSRLMFDPIARHAVEFLPKGKEWLKVNRMLAEGRNLNPYAVAENRRLWTKGYALWAALVMMLTRFNPFDEHAVEVESSKNGTQLRVGDYTFKAPGGVTFMLELQAMISSAVDTRPDETREERLDRTVDMFKGFLMSKISPAISLGYEQFTGRDVTGKPSREAYTPLQVWWDNAIRPSLREAGVDHEMPKWSNLVANRMLYLWAQDALETYEATLERNADAPGLEAAFTGASAFLGGRVRYAPKETRWMYDANDNATPPGWEYSFIGADPDDFFKALPAGE